MKVAIIGAGVAGVCAGRHCKDAKFQFDIFEQTEHVGGIWNYTDTVGVDKYGLPINTPQYKGLRTNQPKEVMEFEDFHYPELEQSYVGQREVLDYILGYVRHFELEPHIKFLTQVVRVRPEGKKWLVQVKDLKTSCKEDLEYDAVIVCNGHHMNKFLPQIKGLESFAGTWKHSHDYRGPDDMYKNKRLLLLGAGPSGVDISGQLAPVADKVFLSFGPRGSWFPVSEDVTVKPLVKEIRGNKAVFEDNTTEQIDEIIFCTGYNYDFPFLTEKCKIKIDNNCVNPLYKQIINIEHPTMAFIGLLWMICPFPESDIQVRFFLATLNGHFKLPSKDEMLEDFKKTLAKFDNTPSKFCHSIGLRQGEYFDDLADTAKIKRIRPVINKLYYRIKTDRNLDYVFKILDDENFLQIK